MKRRNNMETPRAKAEMQEYLKTHKINDYFPAYGARRRNNHLVLMEVAEEVKKHGFRCYCAEDYYKHQSTSLVYAVKDDKCVTFGFAEVPYRWYINSEHQLGMTAGLVGEHGYDYPFDIEDILSNVVPNRFKNGYFDSKFWVEL